MVIHGEAEGQDRQEAAGQQTRQPTMETGCGRTSGKGRLPSPAVTSRPNIHLRQWAGRRAACRARSVPPRGYHGFIFCSYVAVTPVNAGASPSRRLPRRTRGVTAPGSSRLLRSPAARSPSPQLRCVTRLVPSCHTSWLLRSTLRVSLSPASRFTRDVTGR